MKDIITLKNSIKEKATVTIKTENITNVTQMNSGAVISQGNGSITFIQSNSNETNNLTANNVTI